MNYTKKFAIPRYSNFKTQGDRGERALGRAQGSKGPASPPKELEGEAWSAPNFQYFKISINISKPI